MNDTDKIIAALYEVAEDHNRRYLLGDSSDPDDVTSLRIAEALRAVAKNIEAKPIPDLTPRMVRLNGSSFRCPCGANVFHWPDKDDPNLWECNACETRFRSDE